MIKNKILFGIVVAGLCVSAIAYHFSPQFTPDNTGHTVSFNRDIRPILNKNCTSCHGGVTKQGNISYVIRDEALGRGKSGRRNVVPGDASASELVQRITSTNLAYRMPYKQASLKKEEIDLLKQWINEGAEWEEHWAFIPPRSQPTTSLPSNGTSATIDHFINSKRQEQGLAPAQPASRSSWLRRVSLDLTGLPPAYSDVETFLNDDSSDAFEKQVDRLQASKRFGEKWASMWLDIARYADSAGYEKDTHRDVWPYRDWVINAFNENIGYDEFIIKQLAGDLLPSATVDDFLATTFHRLTPVNHEGGTDDEEYRTLAIQDRNATTWAAFNGLTMNCVQCHSHPYDPLEHEDYYTSLAYFNTSQDADKTSDSPHVFFAKSQNEKDVIFSHQTAMNALMSDLVASAKKISQSELWSPLEINTAIIDEDVGQLIKIKQSQEEWFDIEDEAKQRTKTCHAAENAEKKPAKQEADKDDFCKTEYSKLKWKYRRYLTATKYYDNFLSAPKAPVSLGVLDGSYLEEKPIVSAIGEFKFTSTVLENTGIQEISALKITALPFDINSATHTPDDGLSLDGLAIERVTADGKRSALSFKSFIPDNTDSIALHLTESTATKTDDRFIAHRLFSPASIVAALTSPIALKKGDKIVVRIKQLQQSNRRDGKPYYLTRAKLAFLPTNNALSVHKDMDSFAKSLKAGKKLIADLNAMQSIKVPVMAEQMPGEKRATRLFQRGNYLEKIGTDLTPATPRIFSSARSDKSQEASSNEKTTQTRLDLANWFVSDNQPLTARVAANRFWEQLFGLGLVETLEDFGSIGTPPSHPELLDWLAVHFQRDLKWDVKALLKEITLSATYRQSAVSTPEAQKNDPANKWLSHGPRQRLTAEMVRDQALFSSGLLSEKMGGAPVMPPQPDGVWQTIANNHKWVNATDEDRYRRGVYTYSKRSAPYPSFMVFDDAGHAISSARRIPTNTPLQALVTLNDIVYHEAAMALGLNMQEAAQNAAFKEGIDLGFKAILSRPATDAELHILRPVWEKAIAEYSADDTASLKAWTDIASVLLNSDESLSR